MRRRASKPVLSSFPDVGIRSRFNLRVQGVTPLRVLTDIFCSSRGQLLAQFDVPMMTTCRYLHPRFGGTEKPPGQNVAWLIHSTRGLCICLRTADILVRGLWVSHSVHCPLPNFFPSWNAPPLSPSTGHEKDDNFLGKPFHAWLDPVRYDPLIA